MDFSYFQKIIKWMLKKQNTELNSKEIAVGIDMKKEIYEPIKKKKKVV